MGSAEKAEPENKNNKATIPIIQLFFIPPSPFLLFIGQSLYHNGEFFHKGKRKSMDL
jgi:hypothetical protein